MIKNAKKNQMTTHHPLAFVRKVIEKTRYKKAPEQRPGHCKQRGE